MYFGKCLVSHKIGEHIHFQKEVIKELDHVKSCCSQRKTVNVKLVQKYTQTISSEKERVWLFYGYQS